MTSSNKTRYDDFYCLSVTGNYSLRINLEDFDGNQRYAEYKNFKLASEKVLMLTDP